MSRDGNLFSDLPRNPSGEQVTALLSGPNVRVERIVSTGQASPPGFWYDQDDGEWVMLLAGSARIVIDGSIEPVHLTPGDHLNFPPHMRHRVEWTDPAQPTIWLAVHYR